MKCVLVSFDSTMRSNLSVGMPIDLVCYERDASEFTIRHRFAPGDAYFSTLSKEWSEGVGRCSAAFPAVPPPIEPPREYCSNADEPGHSGVERPRTLPYFLTCDHAGARVPRKLGSLGVSAEDMRRHIARDIGAGAVAARLAAALDAVAILQTYSRLVIDCNRKPGIPESIVRISESTRIPGNEMVTVAEDRRA